MLGEHKGKGERDESASTQRSALRRGRLIAPAHHTLPTSARKG